MNPLARLRRLSTSSHARQTALTSLVTYAGMGLSVLSAPVVAQTLGADGRGVLAGTFVVVQVIGWVAFLGLPNGLALQVEKRAEISLWGVCVVGLIGLLAGVLTFVMAPELANADPRIELGVRIVSVLLVFAGLSNIGDQLSLLRGAVYVYNSIRAATLVLPSATIIVMFATGTLTLRSAFIATLIGQVLGIGIGLVVALSLFRVRGRARVPWNFSLRFWFSTVFDSVGGRADQLALTTLTSASVVGVYAVAVTCANAASGLAQALAQTSLTRFVKAAREGQYSSLRRLTMIAASATLSTGALITVLVLLYGRVIFGDDFSALPPIVAVLVLAGSLQDIWKLRAARDAASENAGRLAVASAIGVAVMVGVIVVLAVTDSVSGLSMAFAFLAMCVTRLGIHILLTSWAANKRARSAEAVQR